MPQGVEPICVVIGRTRHKMVQAEIQEAAKRGARFIEVRLDFLAKAPDFKRLLADKPCPMVATVRRPADGGRWSGSEDQRRMLLRQAIVSGFDWVDLETDVADDIRRFKDVKRIVSYHNLREVPPDLEKLHERLCRQDPDVVKIAVRPQAPSENLRVLDLLRDPPKPTVALCLGDVGMPCRILAARCGAPFTYAAFNKERGIAPGIPSFDELRKVYHYEQVNSETQVFGVVGDPIGHSLSPLIHNSAFRHAGVNAVYVPFRVTRGELVAFLKEFDRFPVQGYSVTIPHKEAAASLAAEQDPSVALTQAANTLVRKAGPPDGAEKAVPAFAACNTDFQAVLDSLRANLARGPDDAAAAVGSRTVLLLGAGGVARAVAHALHREGAAVIIANRTAERAQKLAHEVGCRAVDWAARHTVICDLLINATSVGMHPKVDDTPIHPSFLKPNLTVMDLVYTPETTLLVKEARGRGCHVITGTDMFVRQAAVQFRLFTGREPPLEQMAKTVKHVLSPVALREEG